MRDTQSYCGILLDDNNRRPIARLYFNTAKKTIVVPTGERDDRGRREMESYALESVDEIDKYGDQLRDVVRRYLQED